MTQTTRPRSPDRGGTSPALEVDVARTGGIAGITRRWSAQLPETEASEWLALIDRCPWDEVSPPVRDEVAPPTEDEARPPAPEASETHASRADDSAGHPEHRPVPDGFMWWIRASWAGSDPREAELFDDQVVGAWRDLVDAVRDWSRERPGPERPGR